MASLVGIAEQNEFFELNNQGIILDINRQSCDFLKETNQFNQENIIDFESGYFLNTKELYKIWFNKDLDIFLSELNKNRLIDLRKDNPKAQISLLYSAGRLSDNAKNEMQDFLSAYCINAVNFDKIYEEAKNNINVSSTELKILTLAKEELDNFAKGNYGGNPAAASDLLRVSKTITEELGIYSDLDVHLKFDDFPLFLKTETPIIMPGNNNDFLAFSCGNNCESISLEAEKKLVQIQEVIIENYDSYAHKDPKHLGYLNENNSVTEARAFIKNIDAHNLFRYYSSEEGSGIYKINQEKAVKYVDLLGNLSKIEVTELFFELLSTPHSIAYHLSTDDDLIAKVSKEPQAYGIKSKSLINKLTNEKKENHKNSIIIELYNVALEEINSLEFLNLPTEYQKDNLLDSDIKKKYHGLIIDDLLESRKFSFYKSSVENLSGPKILEKLFGYNGGGTGRAKYSPMNNHIAEGIIRDGLKQDGSWYLNKL